MKFRVRKWKLQRERDLNYPCVKFILVPTMTNQLKEPRFCPTLAPPRLLMVKSFILTWKKNPKWPILCFSINMHAFNNFYIKNVYIYRYFACHNRISEKIPESNLSLHRGVWKNSYCWSIHTELMKIDMNLRSWVSFVFFNHTLPNNIKTRITAWERLCWKKHFLHCMCF